MPLPAKQVAHNGSFRKEMAKAEPGKAPVSTGAWRADAHASEHRHEMSGVRRGASDSRGRVGTSVKTWTKVRPEPSSYQVVPFGGPHGCMHRLKSMPKEHASPTSNSFNSNLRCHAT